MSIPSTLPLSSSLSSPLSSSPVSSNVNGTNAYLGPRGLSSLASKEMEQIIRRLEQGSILTKFYQKGKPERRNFFIKLDTRQIIWQRPIAGKNVLEGSVDLREVKEIRIGPSSKIFERWHEDTKKWESGQCFVVLYGTVFRLKTLSCVGKNIY